MDCEHLLADLERHDFVPLYKLQCLFNLHISKCVEHRGVELEFT